MILKEALALIDGALLTAECDLNVELSNVFASDLMSDVLAFIEAGSLLLTGLVNAHVVRTASLADVAAVVFVQGKRPTAEIVTEAQHNNLPLASTALTMFEACQRLAPPFRER